VLDGRGIVDQAAALGRQVALMRRRLKDLAVADALNGSRLKSARERLFHVCARREEELQGFPGSLSQPIDQWNNLTDLARKIRALVADCMALEQTVKFRTTDARASSLCGAADRLTEAFSASVGQPRAHYVLVSEAEHFGADASAIHLSFARLEVWNLNRVAHEFGHLWAEEFANGLLGAQRSFVASLTGKWGEVLAKEFFADIVAAVLIGPAYGYSCLLLDFNPTDLLSSDSHPSNDARAHCILIALEHLANYYEGVTKPLMILLTQHLWTFWSGLRLAVGVKESIPNLVALRWSVETAVDRLKDDIPEARYKTLARAKAVEIALASRDSVRPANASEVDVLNGAWFRRVNDPDQAASVERMALEMLST
jgi:hypothetical protein